MPLSKSYNYIITIEGNVYNSYGLDWDGHVIDPHKVVKINKYSKNFKYNLALVTILQDFYKKQTEECTINFYVFENKINKYLDKNFDFEKLNISVHLVEEIKNRLYYSLYSLLPNTIPYQLTSILIANENGVQELIGVTQKELDDAIIEISKNM